MYNQIINNPFRKLVVGVDTQVPLSNGAYTTAINLDNAATTPPFLSVIREINKFAPWYSSIHRGKGYKSMLSTDIYENGRDIIRLLGYSEKDMERYFNNEKALMPGMVRASIGMYNTFEEIDRFLHSLKTIAMNKNYYLKKYENNRRYYKIKNQV